MFTRDDMRTAFRQGCWTAIAVTNDAADASWVTDEMVAEFNRLFDEVWWPHYVAHKSKQN